MQASRCAISLSNSSHLQLKWFRSFIDPPVPVKPVVNPFAIERPHAAPHLIERQGSFRGLSQLNQSSPFKRQMSLRIGDLPSTMERQQNSLNTDAPGFKSNLNSTPGTSSKLLFSLFTAVLCSLRLFSFVFRCLDNPKPPPRATRHREVPLNQNSSSESVVQCFRLLTLVF